MNQQEIDYGLDGVIGQGSGPIAMSNSGTVCVRECPDKENMNNKQDPPESLRSDLVENWINSDTDDGDLLSLAESVLSIYAPYGLTDVDIKKLAATEVKRWKAEK